MPSSTPIKTKMPDLANAKRYAWIDAARGVAILMVIAVHASHGLKGYESFTSGVFAYGHYGVQLFFVASAMTLCMSMQAGSAHRHPMLAYAARRFFRIAPMYYFGIAFYYFWSIAKSYVQQGILAPLPQYSLPNVLFNVFFVHGFSPAAYNSIVPGGWSIAVEMVFYVFFPSLLWAYQRCPTRRALLTAGLLMASWLGVALVQWVMGDSTANSDFLYFNISNQFHVFVIGIYGYFLLPRLRVLPAAGLAALVLVCWMLATLLADLHVFNGRFYSLALYAQCFVFLVALLSRLHCGTGWMQSVGQRSFSMYVLHFFVMNIVEYIGNVKFRLLIDVPDFKALLHLAVAIAITYWLSGFTKRHVEDRFIRLGKQLFKGKQMRSVEE